MSSNRSTPAGHCDLVKEKVEWREAGEENQIKSRQLWHDYSTNFTKELLAQVHAVVDCSAFASSHQPPSLARLSTGRLLSYPSVTGQQPLRRASTVVPCSSVQTAFLMSLGLGVWGMILEQFCPHGRRDVLDVLHHSQNHSFGSRWRHPGSQILGNRSLLLPPSGPCFSQPASQPSSL